MLCTRCCPHSSLIARHCAFGPAPLHQAAWSYCSQQSFIAASCMKAAAASTCSRRSCGSEALQFADLGERPMPKCCFGPLTKWLQPGRCKGAATALQGRRRRKLAQQCGRAVHPGSMPGRAWSCCLKLLLEAGRLLCPQLLKPCLKPCRRNWQQLPPQEASAAAPPQPHPAYTSLLVARFSTRQRRPAGTPPGCHLLLLPPVRSLLLQSLLVSLLLLLSLCGEYCC